MSTLLEQLSTLRGTCPCPVGQVLRDVSDDEAEALNLVLQNSDIPATLIRKTLIANGHRVGRDAVHKHRTETCGCRSNRDAD